MGVGDQITSIGTFNGSQEGSYVFIGEIVTKNQRDANEDINVKKRGGKRVTGQTQFIDLRLRDDTGMILARVNRFDYERMGRELAEQTPIGAHLLVRAKFSSPYRFGFIQKWKRLDQ